MDVEAEKLDIVLTWLVVDLRDLGHMVLSAVTKAGRAPRPVKPGRMLECLTTDHSHAVKEYLRALGLGHCRPKHMTLFRSPLR